MTSTLWYGVSVIDKLSKSFILSIIELLRDDFYTVIDTL
jgi:hypothetical protein